MEIQRLGEPLIRLRSRPILTFLAPSIIPVRRPRTTTPNIALQHLGSTHKAHSFSTSTPNRYAASSSETPDVDRPPASKASSATQRSIDSLLDGLLPQQPTEPRYPKNSSAYDIDEAFRRSGLNRSNLRNTGPPQRGDYARGMTFPDAPSSTSRNGTFSSVSGDMEEAREIRPRAKRTVLSRATVGRTIEVDASRGIDFGRALGNLGILCATNKVKQDFQRQRFHERPGMKRKRLKRERWRKLFKEGFRATVTRVQEMRRKGW